LLKKLTQLGGCIALTSHLPFIGIILVIIGLIVKFEVKVMSGEEQQDLGEGKTKNQ
tara:strand:+ start:533 stop:700 length:168 start_codon:yes stop_codon:yes gene_type:complete